MLTYVTYYILYTILYYTILYYTILYYTILYYTILYYTILCMYVSIIDIVCLHLSLYQPFVNNTDFEFRQNIYYTLYIE